MAGDGVDPQEDVRGQGNRNREHSRRGMFHMSSAGRMPEEGDRFCSQLTERRAPGMGPVRYL